METKHDEGANSGNLAPHLPSLLICSPRGLSIVLEFGCKKCNNTCKRLPHAALKAFQSILQCCQLLLFFQNVGQWPHCESVRLEMGNFLNTFRKYNSFGYNYWPKIVLASKVGNTVWASFLKFSQNIFKDSTTATITVVS